MIKAKEVRLIGADGEQIGTVDLNEALRFAEEKELDLVEVAPNAQPPVCKIMDYGKYKYNKLKKKREVRKKSKGGIIKEIKLRPGIGKHDYEVKIKRAKKFLSSGYKVKVTVIFRGREITHRELADRLLEGLIEETSELGEVEKRPSSEKRNMVMIIAPK